MAPVRLGIVGCGAIAQIQHLPNLASLQDEFSVEVVCDAAPGLARAVAAEFRIPRWVSDPRELLASGVEAVLLCHTDPKTEVAVAALEAGKHLFIEKPVCYSLQEADRMIEAARRAGTVAMAGYMKVYDPAFERARREVARMPHLRFIQIHHYHTDNSHHLSQFRLHRAPGDLPASLREATAQARREAVCQAIGDVPPDAEGAFFRLAGSMIHDLYGLRHVAGPAARVLNTEIWNDGWGISTLLECAGGARCAATWVELRDVRDFKETLEVCGDDRRVLLSYPTGFARGILSTLEIQALDGEGHPVTLRPAIEWESAFVRELRHFHACITHHEPPRTPLEDARFDVALIIDIIRAARR
jgi:predicted dehydrogenase